MHRHRRLHQDAAESDITGLHNSVSICQQAPPPLAVTVERQSEYYQRTASRFSAFFTELAYAVGAVNAWALFGSVKIMHAAVSARTREIATLRAIGYRPLSAAIAVLFEMILLSLAGACCGASLAWLLFDGKVISNFTQRV